MNLLILGWDPNSLTPGGNIIKNLINCHFLKENVNIFLCYEDCGKTNDFVTDDIHFLTYINDAENEKLSTYKKSKILLFIKKLLKTLDKSYSIKLINSYIKKKHHKYHFDAVLVFSEWTNTNAKLFPKLKYIKKRILYMTELSLKNRYTDKEKIDYKIIKKIVKSGILLLPYADYLKINHLNLENIIIVEYPILAETKLSSKMVDKTFIYLGKFYRTIREPTLLIELMKKLPEYTLVIFGDSIKDCEIPINISFRKRLPMNEISMVISKCTALINLENTNTLLTSSKIISYFGYKKPIISFGKRLDLKEEYDSYKSFLNVLDDKGNLINVEIIKKWLKSTNYKIELNNTIFKKYTIEYFSKVIVDIITK